MKPNVNKKIKHTGMTMTEEKHQKWHEEQHEMAIMLHSITEGVATAVQLKSRNKTLKDNSFHSSP